MKRLFTWLLMFSLSTSYAQNQYFGDYKKPVLLEKLEQYQSRGQLWQRLGFHIEYNYHYAVTPLDVIPFAGTGGDGIHFGFVTEFGNVKDLSSAPIVCVSPTNDPPVKLVAKDLKDFLRLVVTVGDAEFLDRDYKSDEEVALRLLEWDKVAMVDWQGNQLSTEEVEQNRLRTIQNQTGREELIKILSSEFQIEKMPYAGTYIRDLRANRRLEVSIETADGLGIIYGSKKAAPSEFDYSISDTARIKQYLDSASKIEKLKFYRDATFFYTLSEGYDFDVKRILVEALRKDGYKREALVLEQEY